VVYSTSGGYYLTISISEHDLYYMEGNRMRYCGCDSNNSYVLCNRLNCLRLVTRLSFDYCHGSFDAVVQLTRVKQTYLAGIGFPAKVVGKLVQPGMGIEAAA